MPSDTVMLIGAIIPIVGILIVGLILLVPIAGLTLRFALKPALEAFAQMRESRGDREDIRMLQHRLTLMEEQLRALAVARVEESRSRERLESAVPSIQVGRIAPPPPAFPTDG